MSRIKGTARVPVLLAAGFAVGLISMNGCAPDFKGGTEMVLQVQVQDAVSTEADLATSLLQEAVTKGGIKDAAIDRSEPARVEDASQIQIVVRGVPADRMPAIQAAIARDWIASPGSAAKEGQFALRPESFQRICREAGEQTVQSLRKRIEALGVRGIVQPRAGSNPPEVLLKLPRSTDRVRLKEMLLVTADLRITAVTGGPFRSAEETRQSSGRAPSAGTVLVECKRTSEFYLVSRSPVISGRDVRDARPRQDEYNKKWDVDFTLTPEAGQRLGRYTEANIGNRLAVVLDSQVQSVATIQSRIEQEGMISNMEGEEAAQDLARYLKAGSLPARVVPISERTIP